jgi:hypothetical protein
MVALTSLRDTESASRRKAACGNRPREACGDADHLDCQSSECDVERRDSIQPSATNLSAHSKSASVETSTTPTSGAVVGMGRVGRGAGIGSVDSVVGNG